MLCKASGLAQSTIPDTSFLRPDLVVHKCVYSPTEIRLLEMCKEAGVKKYMNGLRMMLYQGAAAFKLFTGHDIPIEHMKDLLF